MSHESSGTFTCNKCNNKNVNPQITDLDEDNTLIYCKECGKWVRWH